MNVKKIFKTNLNKIKFKIKIGIINSKLITFIFTNERQALKLLLFITVQYQFPEV